MRRLPVPYTVALVLAGLLAGALRRDVFDALTADVDRRLVRLDSGEVEDAGTLLARAGGPTGTATAPAGAEPRV